MEIKVECDFAPSKSFTKLNEAMDYAEYNTGTAGTASIGLKHGVKDLGPYVIHSHGFRRNLYDGDRFQFQVFYPEGNESIKWSIHYAILTEEITECLMKVKAKKLQAS